MTTPTSDNCLLCQKPVNSAAPAAKYTGESQYGLQLDAFWLHDACSAEAHPDKVCAVCKQPETNTRLGNSFELTGPGEIRIAPLWLCNDHAPFAGPQQGVTETYMEDMGRLNR